MSANVQLHDGVAPYLVSPCENFFFLIHHVKLAVESGNGYPGQGGCFYGGEGRCYVSQYRLVFVSDLAANRESAAYQSFSLPFYGIRDWSFDVSLFGAKSWKGHVNRVPGGGLVGTGRFTLEFLSFGFEEFRSHVLPLLENSRALHGQFRDLANPSVLLVPGHLEGRDDGGSRRLAYCSADDPMTLFIVDKKHPGRQDSPEFVGPNAWFIAGSGHNTNDVFPECFKHMIVFFSVQPFVQLCAFFFADLGEGHFECRKCGYNRKQSPGTGYSNFLGHLGAKHADYSEEYAQLQATATSTLDMFGFVGDVVE
ncbi:hypothetical protein PHYPSEUDO_006688 [Phytophthora pseudosyringae]|uniref:BED-type domain-containing protein n=1 Tax=Phytophthora pseudosyringae TaxID=221518 RepID=A0A8T1VL30_9STRA|nr:hypothetical protein PHYPSEUDO_006688 [Phytophthora pseudosyringae]